MNNSAMNICVHVSVWTYVFTSLPCGGIAESYGNSMFNILMNLQLAYEVNGFWAEVPISALLKAEIDLVHSGCYN